jgi:hypothetical protein
MFCKIGKQSKEPPTSSEWGATIEGLRQEIQHSVRNTTLTTMRRALREPFGIFTTWDETCEGNQQELGDKKCLLLASDGPDKIKAEETRRYVYGYLGPFGELLLATCRITRLSFKVSRNPHVSYVVSDFKICPTTVQEMIVECHCCYEDVFLSLYRVRFNITTRNEQLLGEAAVSETEPLSVAELLVERGVVFPNGWLNKRFIADRKKRLDKLTKHGGMLV